MSTANKEGKALRQVIVMRGKAEGKSQRQIAKESGISQPTVCRDWKELNQTESLKEAINELKLKSIAVVLDASDVERKFVKSAKNRGLASIDEIKEITKIKVTSKNIYSSLQGDGTGNPALEPSTLSIETVLSEVALSLAP